MSQAETIFDDDKARAGAGALHDRHASKPAPVEPGATASGETRHASWGVSR